MIPFVLPDVISGMILMWSGTIATIPAGFLLCDGNNGTPDLRDKFIVGARQDETGVAKTNVTGALTQKSSITTHLHGIGPHVTGAAIGDTLTVCLDTPAVGVKEATHTHSIPEDDTDLATALPPYYALAYIMKT